MLPLLTASVDSLVETLARVPFCFATSVLNLKNFFFALFPQSSLLLFSGGHHYQHPWAWQGTVRRRNHHRRSWCSSGIIHWWISQDRSTPLRSTSFRSESLHNKRSSIMIHLCIPRPPSTFNVTSFNGSLFWLCRLLWIISGNPRANPPMASDAPAPRSGTYLPLDQYVASNEWRRTMIILMHRVAGFFFLILYAGRWNCQTM